MLRILLLCTGLLAATALFAQDPLTLRGSVLDATDDAPLVGATIRLTSAKDSTVVKGAFAERDGGFRVKDVPPGPYRMTITYVGFKKLEQTVFARESRTNLGTFKLQRDTVKNREVNVEGMAVRVEVKGDTTEYNAAAFKTNPNASAEDLVKKMPGITVENGTIKAQGEELRRVTVDGREFFGDDASATLKNLPADMVDRVQVFDRGSDLSMFSGFDDGNTQKTMNITTKKDRRSGSFGRAYGGYGLDNRYNAGVTLNDFREAQRISVLGLSNNVNQQNFAFQDILGATGGGGMMGRMMSRFAGSAGSVAMSRMGGGGFGGGGGGSFSNFFSGQQGGISTTNALGMNYSDVVGRTNISSSYFFNYADNARETQLDRQYITPSIASQRYSELNTSTSINRNHRFNARIESFIDSANALIITPRVVYQASNSNSLVDGITSTTLDTLNTTTTDNLGTNGGYTASVGTTYRRLFETRGRTLAATLNVDGSNRWNGNNLLATNAFYTGIDSTFRLDQRADGGSTSLGVGGQIAWTEPIGESDMIQFSYEPNITRNTSRRVTNDFDATSSQYSVLDSLLSNTFENTYQTHRAGALYRWRMENTIVTMGGNYQYALLTGDQLFPRTDNISRTFQNVLPTLMIQHKFSQQSNIRMFYRTSTNAPSISQLQNVVDNSNPVQLRVGNPNLVQEYSHSFNARLVNSNWMMGRTMFGVLNLSYTANFIGSSNIITRRDTVIGDNVVVGPGTQITTNENFEGMWNARAFFTHGFPLLGTNFNLNGALVYSRTPGRINSDINYANSTTGSAGFFIGSANSEDLDVSLSYNGMYTWVANTLQRSADDNYFTHIASARVIWNIGPLACSTDVANSLYQGLGTDFNRMFTVWNAGVGYRFPEDTRAFEVRLSIYDILNQNDAINRSINDISIEDTRTNALRQYALLTISYDLKAFGAGGPKQ